MHIRRTLTIVSALTAGFVLVHAQEPKPNLEAPQSAATYHVYAGDRMLVRHGFEYYMVRLYGISCPKRGHPLSKEARKFTRRVAAGKVLKLDIRKTTDEGLLLAEVTLPDGSNLNEELIRAGLAWADRSAQNPGAFLNLEIEARDEGAGLWSEQAAHTGWNADGIPETPSRTGSEKITGSRKAA